MAQPYIVTITAWEKHNQGIFDASSKKKIRYTHFMLYSGFFSDPKIAHLSQAEILLYLNLLCVATEVRSKSVVITSTVLPKCLGSGDKKLLKSLEALQSLQLVTFEKEVLLNKGKEKKGTTDVEDAVVSESPPTPPVTLPTIRSEKPKEARGKIEELSKHLEPGGAGEKLLENVTHRVQQAWVEAYHDPAWICAEMRKANAWIAANPKKAAKDFGRFFTSWLSRAHEDHRKTIPSNKPKHDPQGFRSDL